MFQSDHRLPSFFFVGLPSIAVSIRIPRMLPVSLGSSLLFLLFWSFSVSPSSFCSVSLFWLSSVFFSYLVSAAEGAGCWRLVGCCAISHDYRGLQVMGACYIFLQPQTQALLITAAVCIFLQLRMFRASAALFCKKKQYPPRSAMPSSGCARRAPARWRSQMRARRLGHFV